MRKNMDCNTDDGGMLFTRGFLLDLIHCLFSNKSCVVPLFPNVVVGEVNRGQIAIVLPASLEGLHCHCKHSKPKSLATGNGGNIDT
jgi:hypothetical protein